MKILAFAASNNKKSINQKLAIYAASLLPNAKVETLNINDYEMPIFSDEREAQLGSPSLAQKFYKKITEADALIISFAEHNGNYTAAYKNLFDWTSRINTEVYQHKPTILLSTSPGKSGASNVLKIALDSGSYYGMDTVDSLSVPEFFENFDIKKHQLSNKLLRTKLKGMLFRLSENR